MPSATSVLLIKKDRSSSNRAAAPCSGRGGKYIWPYIIGRTMQESGTDIDVLSTPGYLVSLVARGFTRLSEARLTPLGFGVGYLPVLVALRIGRADTQRDLAHFARIQQPPMAQMLTRMERTGLSAARPTLTINVAAGSR